MKKLSLKIFTVVISGFDHRSVHHVKRRYREQRGVCRLLRPFDLRQDRNVPVYNVMHTAYSFAKLSSVSVTGSSGTTTIATD